MGKTLHDLASSFTNRYPHENFSNGGGVVKEAIVWTFWQRYRFLLSRALETFEAIENIQDAFACTFPPRYNFLLDRALETCEAIKNIHDPFTRAKDGLAKKVEQSLLGFIDGRRIAAPADIGEAELLLTRAEEKLAQVERSLLGFVNGAQIAAPANVGKEIADTDRKRTHHGITPFENKVAKTKRGLPGFINGSRTAALADTGATQNIISADFAFRNGVILEGKTTVFRLGNSRRVQSAGIVKVRWAFAEKPTELYEIVCHVIEHCTYDVILGSNFLTVTETFSKHLHRLVKCVFNVFDVFNVFHLTLMDGGRQTLDGQIGDWSVHAILDTGAERNVMDSIYAEALGFKVSRRSNYRGFLQFADGTFQETVGQVDTTWTFTSGLEIPITFEILENCSADVILGEDFLLDHDVFRSHAASMQEILYEDEQGEPADLSPFGYTNYWQQKFENGRLNIMSKFNRRTHTREISEDETLPQHENEERRRRDQWTHQYGFEGVNASPAEKEAEARRREKYNARIEAFRRRPPRPGRDAPLTASTPTAPEITMSRRATAAPPVIPSIPTAPDSTTAPPVPPAATRSRGTAPPTSTSTALVSPDNVPSNTAIADQVRRGRRFR